MQTIKLLIEFDGTDFHGWQFQPNLRTVQGDLEAALGELTGRKTSVRSSSRTDAGVHSRGMPVVFTTEKSFPLVAYLRGLNGKLPVDISVVHAEEVAPTYDPRKASDGKVYEYRIWNHSCRSALEARTSWYLPYPMDIAAMQQAAPHFCGSHDFSAFRAAGCDSVSTNRDIFESELRVARPNLLIYRVYGNAFLRKMVRIMVGTIVDVGLGSLASDEVPDILASGDRVRAGRTAPPEGLFLHEVIFS